MIFRAARHTNDLKTIKEFYTQVLGLDFLGDFINHNNYNGLFLGKKGNNWHLEFTESDDKVTHRFDEDDCFVFYPTTQKEYNDILKRVEINKVKKVVAKNPYWNDNGIMILDPDGYRIIISPQKIEV